MIRRISILVLSFLIFSAPLWAAVNFLDNKVVKLGEAVPDFELKDTAETSHKLSGYKGNIIMIHFWSATCPFVLRYDEQLKQIAEDYQKQGVVVLGIDSNTNEKIEDIKKVTEVRKVNYPILLDPGNKVADQFGAITTPHVFILDKEGKLIYEGAVDDQGWSEDHKPEKFYVRNALGQVLKGEAVTVSKTKSVGCTIKRF